MAIAAPVREPIGWSVWRVTIVVVLGSFMSVLDTTIVNVALRSLSLDLHTSLDSIQWVVTAYLLALAAVIPVTGWAARRYGARRVFLASAILFTLGSMLCGFATSPAQLIIFRGVQGLGGGMLVPIGQIILVKKAGPVNLSRVMSVVAVPVILAPILGPTLGGLLIDGVGWRWIFFVNLPVGVAAVFAALKFLDKDVAEDAGPLDLAGLVLVAVGLVGITYALAEIATAGIGSPRVYLPLVLGSLLVTAFVVRALHIERPLLDMRLYQSPAFGAASITVVFLAAAFFGSMILMPLYFQTVRHEDAITTGLLLGPQGIGTAIAMVLSSRSVDRFGAGITSLVGAAITVIGTVPFVLIGAHTSYTTLTVVSLFRGIGVGLSMMPAMIAAYRVIRHNQVNDATPQLNVLMRVGGSIGTAMLAVILHQRLTESGSSVDAQAAAFRTTFGWVIAITAVAMLPTLLLIRAERRALRLPDVATEPAEPLLVEV